MHKNKIFILAISITILSLSGIYIYNTYIKRTPETIIKQVCDIKLSNFDYSVISFDEYWLPNGDGTTRIILKLHAFTENEINYIKSKKIKPLPLTTDQKRNIIADNIILKNVNSTKGYYLYSEDAKDNRNYLLLIFDLENNEIVYECQVL